MCPLLTEGGTPRGKFCSCALAYPLLFTSLPSKPSLSLFFPPVLVFVHACLMWMAHRPPFALGPGRGQLRLGVRSSDRGGGAQIGNNNVEGGSLALPAARLLRPRAGRGVGTLSLLSAALAKRAGPPAGARCRCFLRQCLGAPAGTIRKLDLCQLTQILSFCR